MPQHVQTHPGRVPRHAPVEDVHASVVSFGQGAEEPRGAHLSDGVSEEYELGVGFGWCLW